MVRLFNIYYPRRTLVLALSELLLVILAWLIPMTVSYGGDTVEVLLYEGGLMRVAVAVGVLWFCVYYVDLYSASVQANPAEVWTRIFVAIGSACIVLAVLYEVAPGARLQESVLFPGVVLASAGLCASRAAFFRLNRSPRWAERALLLGSGPLVSRLAAEISKRPELGIGLIGYIGSPSPNGNSPAFALKQLGELSAFAEVIRERPVDRVIVTMSERRGALPVQDLLRLQTQGVMVQDGSQLYETMAGRLPLDSVSPGSMLFSSGFHVSSSRLLKKRLYSLVISAVALVVTSPLMLLTALAVMIESPGGALFRQRRVGLGGRVFEILKFRSMSAGAESMTGPVWAQEKDPRVTRVGRVIRKLRFDELPQLVNILRGDMNIVGPRPERPHFVEMLCDQIPYYGLRHSVTPGLTGWAQVCYPYGSSVEESREKLEYDLFYVKNMSLSLDLLILFITLKTVLLGRGAK
jgi:sugar transferase (PEP-CTERM system associated)